MIKRLIHRFRRFIAYGLTGCVNSAVDFLVYSLLLSLIGLPPWLSQAGGYIAGLTCSFIINSNVAFRDSTRKRGVQLVLFLLVNGVSLAVSLAIVHLLTNHGLNAYIAKVCVLAVITLINYFGYKLIVFRVKPEEGEDKHE